jgi:hypothetical protein
METKHTKGKWKYTKAAYSPYLQFNIETVDQSHSNTFIGECGGGNQPGLEIEANAKLIAAAPELLEALKLVYNLIDKRVLIRDISKDGDYSYFIKQSLEITKTVNLINDAIKKATE